jgi:hypothetical protein
MPLDLRRSPGPFTWRGIDFHVTECSLHSGSCRFESTASRWVVRRFDRGGTWYARLKLGCHRFEGKGTSKIRALDAALEAATTVQSDLQEALPPLLAPAVAR